MTKLIIHTTQGFGSSSRDTLLVKGGIYLSYQDSEGQRALFWTNMELNH